MYILLLYQQIKTSSLYEQMVDRLMVEICRVQAISMKKQIVFLQLQLLADQMLVKVVSWMHWLERIEQLSALLAVRLVMQLILNLQDLQARCAYLVILHVTLHLICNQISIILLDLLSIIIYFNLLRIWWSPTHWSHSSCRTPGCMTIHFFSFFFFPVWQ